MPKKSNGIWRGEFSYLEIELVLDEINSMRSLSSSGVSYSGGYRTIDDWQAVLVSMIEFQAPTHALKSRIVSEALSSKELREGFLRKEFEGLICKLFEKYRNDPSYIYKVFFPIWGAPKFLKGVKKVSFATINFTPSNESSFFRKACGERKKQYTERGLSKFFTKDRLRDLSKCSLCVVHVRAYDVRDAYERASDALYEVLGAVNLARDTAKISRRSFRTAGTLPVSDVLIAPHTTVHDENGALAYQGFWFENWEGGSKARVQTAERAKAWEASFLRLQNGVQRSNWKHLCKSALIRHFRAFSNPDLNESFLEGWRLFENVSGVDREKTDDLIDRVSNVFADKAEYKLLGKHLRHRRNQIAHGRPVKVDDQEVLAYQMLNFIGPFMEHLILNEFSFKSERDFWDFLSLPNDKAQRERRKKDAQRELLLLDKAAYFRGEG
ncbi:hypothetical protein [Pseudovibrio sp. Ad26]|uniref:hypothetical protein n=1 Tax=Pseudovibrio sp. Ad26 TaxID=989410 RepID=UPI0007B2EA16|nr:hypothetical protein [Pseudovibrio sp. Ad26]KZL10614.1 hypothetical protein PsAD26_03300 [Pseudovibrio sp. Ad26]